MDEIQLSALKYIVNYAYEHTLFYKKLYNNIDISSLTSIEELPIVTTEFLKSILMSLKRMNRFTKS